MSGDAWDELLNEAREALREQEESNPNAELGDDMTPAPEAHFMGRWRSDDGKMVTSDRGAIDVYFVWDRRGQPGFLYRHAQLVAQVDEHRPDVGDEILVLRGPTHEFEKNGESRRTYPYVLRRRPCSDPLPGTSAGPEQPQRGGVLGDDEELPFLCPAGSATRSACYAGVVTGLT